MSTDFNQQINRKNTNSLKYDFCTESGKPEDILPLWVADMDFQTPAPVLQALEQAVQHGIFGYSESKQPYFDALSNWYSSRFGWKVKPEWLVKTPGVVFAIAAAIRALTEKGDAVMIQQPVYYPFAETIRVNERRLINNALIYENGAYHINFEDFEAKIIQNQVKVFLLCSPHNPVGRVWTSEELIRLGDICLQYGVFVISDEIHSDFVYEGFKHHIFVNLKPEYEQNTITCTAPSKTFNLAGLQASNIFIPNQAIKEKFQREIKKTGYDELNTMSLVACQAAYEYGAPWLEELKQYLAGNLTFIRCFLAEHLPGIRLVEPQGTYLVWLDFRQLGLSDSALEDLIINRAKLWLDRGAIFGADGTGFERINMACPRATLEKAFDQLEQAVRSFI